MAASFTKPAHFLKSHFETININFMKKVLLSALGGILGVGLLLPLFFETSDAGINYLNAHGFFYRVFHWPGLIALASAFVAGGLIGGWKDYTNFHFSETVQGESRFNPAWCTFIISLIIHLVWIGLLE
jgi:hypothetical protein